MAIAPTEPVPGRSAGRVERSNRRSRTRVRVAGLFSPFGEVIDLSDRGMRLRTTRRWPESVVRQITISDGARTATVEARCVWCRQDGMFSHAVGVAFQSVDAETATALSAMAESCAADRPLPSTRT